MAHIERIPWNPPSRRYLITVPVQGGLLEMHAFTRRGAERVARKLDVMADRYERWESAETLPDGPDGPGASRHTSRPVNARQRPPQPRHGQSPVAGGDGVTDGGDK